MAFVKQPQDVQFADLKGVLSQSRAIDPALYQTIQILLERLDQFKTGHDEVVTNINNSVNTIIDNSTTVIGGSADLDYLGNYSPTARTTYNDGDIVIGDDGIAYMCVKDGTTTPPEPWPGSSSGAGGGTAGPHAVTHQAGGSDVVDVKLLGGFPANSSLFLNGSGTFAIPSFGLITAHHLSHETGGTDAIVALAGSVITSGTIADARLSSNVAKLNQSNIFTASPLGMNTVQPEIRLYAADQAVDHRMWRIIDTGDFLYFQATDDGITVQQGAVTINRAGILTAGGGLGATPLNAASLTGLVPDASLSVNVLRYAGGYPGGTTNFLRSDGAFAAPPSSGGGGAHHTTHETGGADAVVSLDGAVITSGTVADARLSANVPLLNSSNTFTGLSQNLGRSVILEGSFNPRLAWRNTAEGTDRKIFEVRWQLGEDRLKFSSVNDAQTAVISTPLQLDRSGSIYVETALYEKNRTTPVGHWINYTPTLSAGSVAPSGGTTIAAEYTLIGKTMIMNFQIQAFTLSNTSGTFYISLPLTTSVSSTMGQRSMPVSYTSDGTNWKTALAYYTSSSTVLGLYNTVWSTVAGGNSIWGTMIISVG